MLEFWKVSGSVELGISGEVESGSVVENGSVRGISELVLHWEWVEKDAGCWVKFGDGF